jgi:hypothetical protein
MVDIINKRCLECNKQPTFNYEGEKNGLYCKLHKKENMVDIINKRCLDCNKQPTFNYEGEKNGLYCKLHKKENMINVLEKRKCLECKSRPTFNYEGEKNGLYCNLHKKENMVDIINKRCLNCNKQPTFNYEGEKNGLYCDSHKKNGMVNVVSKKCQTPLCEIQISNLKYNGYCMRCFMYTFPDKPVSRNYKTKETSVKDFVLSNNSNETWIGDKRIQDGCSKNRPDLICDFGEKLVIVEIDENQHVDYNSTCQIARLNNLSQDVYFRPIILIRFNPDDYIDEKGEKIKSPWIKGKDGIIRIIKKTQTEWNKRLQKLDEEIKKSKSRETKELIEIVHLFYDGCNSTYGHRF